MGGVRVCAVVGWWWACVRVHACVWWGGGAWSWRGSATAAARPAASTAPPHPERHGPCLLCRYAIPSWEDEQDVLAGRKVGTMWGESAGQARASPGMHQREPLLVDAPGCAAVTERGG